MESFYKFDVATIDGHTQQLGVYRGRVLLIVNVASRCGFTPQYEGLEKLYRKYRQRGFTVLGFPCDQFGQQEPGNEAEIKDFCRITYDVTFPLFAKINVNAPSAHALYEFLKSERRGFLGTKAIKWNFTKFLTDREGNIIRRFGPMITPAKIEKDLLQILPE